MILKALLQLVLLSPITNLLVRIRLIVEVPDALYYSQKYTQTLFVLKGLSKVFWPTVMTVLLDEVPPALRRPPWIYNWFAGVFPMFGQSHYRRPFKGNAL